MKRYSNKRCEAKRKDRLRPVEINFKRLNENAVVPSKGTEYSAGMDLYACPNCTINIAPGKTAKIGTGIAVEIPVGYFGAVFARSGLATKQGLRPANCVGVIDSDYRGELIVAIHNDSDSPQQIFHKDRIAQLVILPYLPIDLVEKDELSDTERGAGGFGSTGVGIKK